MFLVCCRFCHNIHDPRNILLRLACLIKENIPRISTLYSSPDASSVSESLWCSHCRVSRRSFMVSLYRLCLSSSVSSDSSGSCQTSLPRFRRSLSWILVLSRFSSVAHIHFCSVCFIGICAVSEDLQICFLHFLRKGLHRSLHQELRNSLLYHLPLQYEENPHHLHIHPWTECLCLIEQQHLIVCACGSSIQSL